MITQAKPMLSVVALLGTLATAPVQAGDFNLEFEAQVIDLVNEIRQDEGLSLLTLDSRLRDAALAHSIDMAETPCFSHDSCDGTNWAARIWSYYPPASGIGENIAAGYFSPDAVVDAWMNSAGHRANILNEDWLGIGVGYYYLAGSPYGHYWTQDFGTLQPVPEAQTYALMLAGLGLVGLMARRRAGRA